MTVNSLDTGTRLVSVVIPVRNGQNVLLACLEALQHQTFDAKGFEVIVVDDESTDDTASLVENVARTWKLDPRSPRLKLVRQEWAGAGAARNRGVEESEGDIVLFTDADCEPVEDWITEMLVPLEDKDVAGVAGAYLTKQKSLIARLAQAEFEERYRFVARYTDIDAAFTHSAAFRRSVFLTSGGFDERMPNNADDLELSYRIAVSGNRIVFAPKALVYHRHPATLADYMRKKFGRGYWRTLVFKRYPGKLVRDSYTPPLLKLQILLAGIAVGSLAASFIGPSWLAIVAGVAVVILVVTGVPFSKRIRGSVSMKVFAPIFLLAQAVAVGAGVLFGMFDNIHRYDTGGRRR